MCNPAVGMVLTAVSGAVQAYGAYQSGRAASKQARYNAELADKKRHETLVRGEQEVGALRDNLNREAARARVRAAASGIDIGFGSTASVLASAELFREQDVNRIRVNAARAAWGYKVEANDYLNRGRIAMAAGQNQAIGTVVSTAGDIYGQGTGSYW